MTKIASSLAELVGGTPMLALDRYCRAAGVGARIVAKLESFNPGGSVKDRVALAMIEDAEASGRLAPGGMIIEPTSGNTGIGLAWVGAVKGYPVTIVMPDTMSAERRGLMKAFGAALELTPGAEGMKGAIARAEELRAANPGSVILQQFDNPANPAAHEHGTAEEIWRDTAGSVDIFVAGVGTGGTVSGTGRRLKQLSGAVQVVAVEPADSPVLGGGRPGSHKLQGIGAGFIPGNYDPSVVDRIAAVTTEEAFDAARRLVATEGVLAGISSGAALAAAEREARRPENAGKTIVVLLPDTGDRYLSTDLFNV